MHDSRIYALRFSVACGDRSPAGVSEIMQDIHVCSSSSLRAILLCRRRRELFVRMTQPLVRLDDVPDPLLQNLQLSSITGDQFFDSGSGRSDKAKTNLGKSSLYFAVPDQDPTILVAFSTLCCCFFSLCAGQSCYPDSESSAVLHRRHQGDTPDRR